MKITIVSCFETYKSRYSMVKEYFENKDYDVELILSDYSHMDKEYIQKKVSDITYIHVPSYTKNLSFKRFISHRYFASKVRKYLQAQEKNDVLWVILPTNALAKEIGKYKFSAHSCVVFDIMDLWPEAMPLGRNKYLKMLMQPVFKYLINSRNKHLQKSDLIVTECNLFKESLDFSHQIETLYLSKSTNQKNAEKNDNEAGFLSKNSLNLCYVGSINNIIDIPCIITLIQSLSLEYSVQIKIIGDGEKREYLLEQLKEKNILYNYYGKIYDFDEKIKLLSDCDYAINIMKETVLVGLTMKSIDYFQMGIPIINNIGGDTWKIVEERNVGYNLGECIDLNYQRFQSNNVLKLFEEEFSYDAFTKRMFEIEEIILKKKGNR